MRSRILQKGCASSCNVRRNVARVKSEQGVILGQAFEEKQAGASDLAARHELGERLSRHVAWLEQLHLLFFIFPINQSRISSRISLVAASAGSFVTMCISLRVAQCLTDS